MQVDFLAGEYGGNANRIGTSACRTCSRTRRGADVVFDQFYPEDLKGRL